MCTRCIFLSQTLFFFFFGNPAFSTQWEFFFFAKLCFDIWSYFCFGGVEWDRAQLQLLKAALSLILVSLERVKLVNFTCSAQKWHQWQWAQNPVNSSEGQFGINWDQASAVTGEEYHEKGSYCQQAGWVTTHGSCTSSVYREGRSHGTIKTYNKNIQSKHEIKPYSKNTQ